MHFFEYRNDVLHAENVAIAAIADDIGTPFYCYSEATLRRHISVFNKAFSGANVLTAYSVKANSNIAVLKIMASEGAGADVVSAGELARALRAGIPAEKIVYSGVGKMPHEMAGALDARIFQFNVESENELHALNKIACEKNVRAPIAFRINPDVTAGGHEKISTGKAEDKFGVPWSRARDLYKAAAALDGIDIRGIDVHIGSQIADLNPFRAAFAKIADLVHILRSDGHTIDRLDLGGGLGVSYKDADVVPPHPDDYARMIREIADPLGVQLVFEPGRMIAANAGIVVSRVIYVKEGEARTFMILDAAMNDLIRPTLYDAHHEIRPVNASSEQATYDIVGPVCETGDRFARGRTMARVREGDLVAIMSAGAYGAVQASQYNTRPLIPEVLVNGDRYSVIRQRPSFEDIIAGEAIPDWL